MGLCGKAALRRLPGVRRREQGVEELGSVDAGMRRTESSITCWRVRLNLVTSRLVARSVATFFGMIVRVPNGVATRSLPKQPAVATLSQQKTPLLAVFDGNPPSLNETGRLASH